INYYDNDQTKVTLVMYAKDKNNVIPDNIFLLGDFNDWTFDNSYQMKKDGDTGYWWITLDELTAGKEYAFQYAVKTGNDLVQLSDAYSEKILDPWSDKYLSSSIYPNLAAYPEKGDGLVSVFQTGKQAYNWSNATLNFERKDRNNLVIYEMWIHDFSQYRTIEGVTERLDYLESLGVNAIELMPITEFDGNISWGYNPNHYFAPDKAYGTPDDYKKFIDECHKRGIAVILDMVFNHSTGNHPFAKLYWNGSDNVSANNPWYNVKAPHGDPFFQDFNHGFSGTKEYFKRVLQYWMDEYKVDGFRMDLTKGFCGVNCNDRVTNITEYYEAVKANGNDDAYFILEHWTYNEEQGLINKGMLCWNNTNEAYSQTAMGWLNKDDNLSNASKKGWVSYCGSHDEERNFYKALTFGNGDLKGNPENYLPRVPLNMAFNVLLNGPKMIWQFDELGYDFSINYGGERVDPKPLPEANGFYQDETRMSGYQKVAQIIHLRTQLLPDVFVNGTISANVGSGKSVRSISWTQGNTKIYVVGNFNVSGGTQYTGSQTTTLPEGTWYDYLNNNASQTGNSEITLQPGELKVYINNNSIKAPDVPDHFDYISGIRDGQINEAKCIVYPTFVNDYVYIQSEDEVKSVQLINLRGNYVKSAKNVDKLNLSGLPQGMYLLIINFDNYQSAFKIIKL
ncbi:T9SS type A sorting domain-containing protein, partial [Bacteroidales bacterium OttesenSCG-928-I21]|nr:T9SS type A sorting domain-containing protein [Bacteroidales bacterium OttesenSCG-928-I21]